MGTLIWKYNTASHAHPPTMSSAARRPGRPTCSDWGSGKRRQRRSGRRIWVRTYIQAFDQHQPNRRRQEPTRQADFPPSTTHTYMYARPRAALLQHALARERASEGAEKAKREAAAAEARAYQAYLREQMAKDAVDEAAISRARSEMEQRVWDERDAARRRREGARAALQEQVIVGVDGH